jgi:Flp pilus assembly pilin Flp
MVEYGLIVTVSGLVVGAAAGALGHISTIFGNFGRALARAPLPG